MKIEHSPLINDFLCFYIETRVDGELRYETIIYYYPTQQYFIKDVLTGHVSEPYPFDDEALVEAEIRSRVERLASENSNGARLVENGLVLSGHRSLTEVCAPLANELQRCFWVVNAQAGLFRSGCCSEEGLALSERYGWNISAFADTSTNGLRPGLIPDAAEKLIVDEWSYYYAIDSPEAVALQRTAFLNGNIGNLSKDYLKRLEAGTDLLIVHVDGWWEFYTPRKAWFERLQSAWPECCSRSLALAGSPPELAR